MESERVLATQVAGAFYWRSGWRYMDGSYGVLRKRKAFTLAKEMAAYYLYEEDLEPCSLLVCKESDLHNQALWSNLPSAGNEVTSCFGQIRQFEDFDRRHRDTPEQANVFVSTLAAWLSHNVLLVEFAINKSPSNK